MSPWGLPVAVPSLGAQSAAGQVSILHTWREEGQEYLGRSQASRWPQELPALLGRQEQQRSRRIYQIITLCTLFNLYLTIEHFLIAEEFTIPGNRVAPDGV